MFLAYTKVYINLITSKFKQKNFNITTFLRDFLIQGTFFIFRFFIDQLGEIPYIVVT